MSKIITSVTIETAKKQISIRKEFGTVQNLFQFGLYIDSLAKKNLPAAKKLKREFLDMLKVSGKL